MSRSLMFSAVALCLTVILLALSSTVGHSHNLFTQLPSLILGGSDQVSSWLFWQLWLPRAILAVGIGAALAIAGEVFQLLTRNPLGSPDIMGVNAGASAGAVIGTLLFGLQSGMMVTALTGALLAVCLIMLAGGRSWKLGTSVIVAGLAVNATASALTLAGLQEMSQESALQLQSWLLGTLAQRDWQDVKLIWAVLCPCFLLLLMHKRELNIIAADPIKAASVGVPVNRVCWTTILLATLLATAAVVCAGPMAFLALVVPRIAHAFLPTRQFLLLSSALSGAMLLLGADLFTRLLFGEIQLPIGLAIGLVGASYLVFILIWQTRKSTY